MSGNTTTRKKLRDELSRRFVPALRQLGFNGPDRISGNSLDHHYRRVAGGQAHCLSISFDKWKRPRFALDLQIEPPEGMNVLMQRGGQFIQGRAIPGRGHETESWFRADRPWWHFLFGLVSTREQQAVSDALTILPEIERWWHTQEPTKHITVIPTTFRPRNNSEVR